ncbi:MAG: hypothetical protein IKF52_05730 [Clostridia bacterium]|nr:hypothetical protein [Clostridia bacterium]
METFLSFSSFDSLLTYLNIILVGAVVFWAVNNYTYIADVIAYTLAKTFIPIITSMIFGSILGINDIIDLGTIIILLVFYFLLGLFVIKITEKITDYFSSDTIIYFIIVFAIIDSIISWLFSLLISIFI